MCLLRPVSCDPSINRADIGGISPFLIVVHHWEHQIDVLHRAARIIDYFTLKHTEHQGERWSIVIRPSIQAFRTKSLREPPTLPRPRVLCERRQCWWPKRAWSRHFGCRWTAVISTTTRKTQSFGFTSFDLHHNYKTVIWTSLKSLKELVSKNRGRY